MCVHIDHGSMGVCELVMCVYCRPWELLMCVDHACVMCCVCERACDVCVRIELVMCVHIACDVCAYSL